MNSPLTLCVVRTVFIPKQSANLSTTILFNVSVALAVLAVLILDRLAIIPQHQSGFTCGDPSISLQYRGDSIPQWFLAIVTIFTPILLIYTVETVRYQRLKTNQTQMLKIASAWYRDYFNVYVFNFLFCIVAKCLMGYPRPHFMETCKPDASIHCKSGEYIPSYNCTVSSAYLTRDSNKSFPSIHASVSLYFGMFVVVFLNVRGVVLQPRLLAPSLQALVVLWVLGNCCTRVSDHRHHWWDVVVGASIGALSGSYAAFGMCKGFQEVAEDDETKLIIIQ